MAPQLTVGLPFYNNAATLADAIRSVLAQSFQDWELLLVDDGSTDGSANIARNIKDARVKFFPDGANRGLVYRLNQIAHLAQGKYLARMDGDDLMHPERLFKQVQFLENHPDVDLVDTAIYSIDQQSHPTGIRGMSPLNRNADQILEHGLMIHAAVVGHTAWFRDNPYDPIYVRAEDRELWCRTFQSSRFGRIPEPLYFVREGHISVKNYLRGQATLRFIYRKYGPEVIDSREVTKLVLMSFLKGLAYGVFALLGCHDILVSRRNRKLVFSETEKAKQVIDRIKRINIATYRFRPQNVQTGRR